MLSVSATLAWRSGLYWGSNWGKSDFCGCNSATSHSACGSENLHQQLRKVWVIPVTLWYAVQCHLVMWLVQEMSLADHGVRKYCLAIPHDVTTNCRQTLSPADSQLMSAASYCGNGLQLKAIQMLLQHRSYCKQMVHCTLQYRCQNTTNAKQLIKWPHYSPAHKMAWSQAQGSQHLACGDAAGALLIQLAAQAYCLQAWQYSTQ